MPQNSATHTSLTVSSAHQEKKVAPVTSETKSSQAEDNKKIMRKLVIVFILAAIFMGIEIGGGIIAGSIAILSDAAHMLSDLLGFVISIVSVYISGFKASKKHSYGFHRAGVIGALASVLIIWILSGFLIYFAIIRMINIDKVDVEGPLMFGIACFGLLTNLVMVKVLHSGHHHHGHSHGHSHSHGNDHSHGHSHKEKKSEKECTHKHEDVKELEMQPTIHKHSENCDHHHHEHKEAEHQHHHESHSQVHNENENHKHEHKSITLDKEQNKIENQENIVTLSKEADHHHDHDHNCDHKEESEAAPKNLSKPADKDNLNIRATVIHILGDILQSIGVIIASILIWISPDKLKIVDPILTFIFAIIVLCTTLRVARDCIFVLMEGTPMELDHEDFEEKLKKVEGVSGLHDLHVWSLGVGKPAMSAHVYTNSDLASVLKKTTEVCRRFGILHTTIQIETTTDEENENFVNCEHNIH